MRERFLDKRIPTVFGLVLIVIGVALTSYLVNHGFLFTSKASPSQNPENVKITNISDTSFTVSYSTQDIVLGSVNYGTTSTFGQTALDSRDSLSKSVTPHNIHSITASNLLPSTTYYFSITSGDNKYLNNQKPFSVVTGPAVSSPPPAQAPATGKIILPNGTKPKEAIVYLFTDQSEVVSALSTDGTYILPLNSLRAKDFSDYLKLEPKTNMKIVAYGDGLSSNVVLNEDQINPVPTITLSNNYDFTSSQAPLSSASTKEASSSGFPVFDEGSASFNPTIDSPQSDQGLSDSQPVFKGTALPNENVEITIHSNDQISDQVTTDANGNWQYRPKTPLSPGNHTVTITTKGPAGILKTITQSFTVYAEGTQIADTSTNKATLSTTPTPPITPSPTPLASIVPSIVPSLSPTILPTIAPTASPTAVIISQSSPPTIIAFNQSSSSGNTLPPTGSNSVGIVILGIGLALIGIFLFIFTRGGIPL